ncbi:MAG: multidrug resistance protein [Rickettsiaceae bacterium]|jgi:DHA2 family multidrug resistance protein|nr:multidrug resistance protein [Rickettsiaceae bacterium]
MVEAVLIDEFEHKPPKLSTMQLLAFFAMVVGMFMAVLDIQIVASSISVIGAGLSASAEELAWVQTSYLIAEVVVIPLSGFLVRLLSTKVAYSIAALGFTIMSFFCSVAWNIESMIVFRALQGFFGGAMIPTVFATSFMIFPKEQRALVSIVIGLVVSVAPTIGPTLGGYITDAISWHFMFLLNIIPGIFVAVTVFFFSDFDQPNSKLLENLDIIGIVLLIISLASLQYILEEGTSKGWFEDSFILSLTILVVLGLLLFIIREFTCNNPIVDLRAFSNLNFSLGCLFALILGIGLFCSVYLMPLYLAMVAGMNTLDIGIVMIVTGAFQFLSAPFAGKIFKSCADKRLMLVFGMGLYALGCYLNSFLTAESRFAELFIPQAVRGFALMFCFMPINTIALDSIPKNSLQNASSLYNLMRNLGGAIGLAMINTYVHNNTKIVSSHFSEHINYTSVQANQTLDMVKNMLNGQVIDKDLAAMTLLDSLVAKEAFIISLNNSFLIISCLFMFSLLLITLIKKT